MSPAAMSLLRELATFGPQDDPFGKLDETMWCQLVELGFAEIVAGKDRVVLRATYRGKCEALSWGR